MSMAETANRPKAVRASMGNSLYRGRPAGISTFPVPAAARYDGGTMAGKFENPADVFKRAIAHAARSLAEQPDLEVTFSGDGPALNGNHAVLPHPPRDLSPKETSRIR